MKALFNLLILIPLTTASAQTSNIEEVRKELKHSNAIIAKEIVKVQNLLDNLEKQDKEDLCKIHVGEEDMTEEDILILGNDMVLSGIEKYDFYLKHITLPLKKDAAGGLYR